MRRTHGIVLSILTAAATSACTGGSDGDTDTDMTARGQTAYEDAETDASGEQKPPASPDPQTMYVEVRAEGAGEIDGLDPSCLDGAAGSFEALYSGDAEIDGDGAYVATVVAGSSDITTPAADCVIEDLSITALTDVEVHAELAATAPNCDAYCSAKARSEAEAECGADPGAATCRATAEGEYTASCTATCESSATYVIVAETALGASALADLESRSLGGSALGTIDVALTFDHIEDGEGGTVADDGQ